MVVIPLAVKEAISPGGVDGWIWGAGVPAGAAAGALVCYLWRQPAPGGPAGSKQPFTLFAGVSPVSDANGQTLRPHFENQQLHGWVNHDCRHEHE
jgi:hypothetical protein